MLKEKAKRIVVKAKESGKKLKDDTVQFIEEHPVAANFVQYGAILGAMAYGMTKAYYKATCRYYDHAINKHFSKEEKEQ